MFVYVEKMIYWFLSLSFIVCHHALEVKQIVHDDRPIIGILSQKITEEFTPDVVNDTTYIAASYVKWMEGAGAQVVPILSTYPKKRILRLVRSINGVIFPGGAAPLDDSNYSKAAHWIFDEAKRLFDVDRRPFPIWGTCLGFEVLHLIASGDTLGSVLKDFDAENLLAPLDLTQDAFNSRLFREIDLKLLRALMFKRLSLHMHDKGISPDLYDKNEGVRKMFKVLASNRDKQGKEFVSLIEGRKYPFYGSQFHPEKNIYEWTRDEKINHSPAAIRASQYLANFFVDEARKSYIETMPKRRLKRLEKQLMFRYSPAYSGGNSLFEQVYTFKNNTAMNKITRN